MGCSQSLSDGGISKEAACEGWDSSGIRDTSARPR